MLGKSVQEKRCPGHWTRSFRYQAFRTELSYKAQHESAQVESLDWPSQDYEINNGQPNALATYVGLCAPFRVTQKYCRTFCIPIVIFSKSFLSFTHSEATTSSVCNDFFAWLREDGVTANMHNITFAMANIADEKRVFKYDF